MENAKAKKINTNSRKPSPKTDDTTVLNGAEILTNTLKDLNVDTIFGYPGGAVLPLYDQLFDERDINHVLVRHEQGGTHAADGYARSTGKPGVVMVTSGPGGTNTVTGIATAAMDSIPLVVFTGQVATDLIGNDAFQEADIVGISRPITKHNYLVKDVENLERVVQEAFHVASSGRPGPVLVDLPKDMLNDEGHYSGLRNVSMPSYNPTKHGHTTQIEKAAEMLSGAKKPLIYAGGGVVLGEAWEELTTMAEQHNIPVTTTLMGLGGFPEGKPQSLGMLGMHGTYYANMAITECDVLLAVGARFDDRVTGDLEGFSPHSKKIHIDIDPTNIGKNVEVEVPIVGDVKNVLPEINEQLQTPDTEKWWKQIDKWEEEHPLQVPDSNGMIKPQQMVEAISEATNGESIVVTDVGQHQMWAAQHYTFNHPRSFLSSGGLGTMGYGLPAAMGAAFGCPDRSVVCITGDGGFQMTAYELATAVEHEIPLKVAVMNNECLGMVRQWQELFFGERYSHSLLEGKKSPDFVKLAESYGAEGIRVTDSSEIDGVLEKAMSINDRPVVMDFRVENMENCYPMVPAGAALNEMVMGAEE